MMTIREFLEKTYEITYTGSLKVRKAALCQDGFVISIQASEFHYCSPRTNLKDGDYTDVELGFPSAEDELISKYAENPSDLCGTVYGWVPVSVVQQLVDKHGGIIGLALK